jgi:hypothetical protein
MGPIVLAAAVVVAGLIGYAVGRSRVQLYEGPAPCRHWWRTRRTEFVGMDVLRDLCSGRLTVEEYRAADIHVRQFEVCNDCGKEWER